MGKSSHLERAIEDLGDGVKDYIKHIRAFLVYEGDNPRYYQKAKMAAGLLGAYVKAEATKTNRMAVDLAAKRSLVGSDGDPVVRELPKAV